MTERFQKTRPSFLESGLPCASLSAESQRDNNARQRPPQNRLHIWWARRPPTVCRAAILAGLLPHDMQLDESVLPPMVDEPSVEDLEDLPPKLQEHRGFFERLIAEVEPTQLPQSHNQFLRALEIRWCPSIAWMNGLGSVVSRLLLKPVAKVRGHPIAQQLLHSPPMVRQTCCPSRRDRLPLLG
jgi:hypothetical protein